MPYSQTDQIHATGHAAATVVETVPGALVASQIQPFIECPGDADGSTVVDIDDVVLIVLQFGMVGFGIEGDVNGSGVVDIDDIVFAILNWGPCE